MTKCSSHKNPPNSCDLECYTDSIRECLEEFTFSETKRIAEKYNVNSELVVAIVCEWKRVENFLQSTNKGCA